MLLLRRSCQVRVNLMFIMRHVVRAMRVAWLRTLPRLLAGHAKCASARMSTTARTRLEVFVSARVRARVEAAAVCARDGASRTARLMGCIPRAGGAPRLRRPRADLSMRVGPQQKLLIEVPSNANVHVVAAVKEVPPVDACACACACACVPARASAC